MTPISHTVTFDTSRHDLLVDLAAQVRAGGAGEIERALEGRIFHALEGHEGVWSDNFDDGEGGDVWHREDPEEPGCAFDAPPHYLNRYEDVLAMLPEGVWIGMLLQSGPGCPWTCVLMGTDLDKEQATGHGADLCRAGPNAALLVRARS